jgi:hypothetical protein
VPCIERGVGEEREREKTVEGRGSHADVQAWPDAEDARGAARLLKNEVKMNLGFWGMDVAAVLFHRK